MYLYVRTYVRMAIVVFKSGQDQVLPRRAFMLSSALLLGSLSQLYMAMLLVTLHVSLASSMGMQHLHTL